MQRGAGITGFYAVRRVGYDHGWALYKRLPLAQVRAAAEGHGRVWYMTEAQANDIRHKEVTL